MYLIAYEREKRIKSAKKMALKEFKKWKETQKLSDLQQIKKEE